MRERIFDGRVVRLERLDGRWEVVRHADAVAVLCCDARGKVAGVWQTRPAIGVRTWEVPAGLIDEGEAPERAAARELAEEAGLGGELRLVTRSFTSPGFSDELVHLFEVLDPVPVHGATPDDDEELELEWLDAREAWERVARGDLATSTVTVLALRHALARAQARGGAPVVPG